MLTNRVTASIQPEARSLRPDASFPYGLYAPLAMTTSPTLSK